jgi:hypothetical protein
MNSWLIYGYTLAFVAVGLAIGVKLVVPTL